jgi:hypothetical protein
MPRLSVSLSLLALMAAVPSAGAWAQNGTNNPNNAAGVTGSQVANPQRPAGTSNPALTTQTLPKQANGSVPRDKNPNQSGATGHTVVPGNNSTLSGDHTATVGTKTGPGDGRY